MLDTCTANHTFQSCGSNNDIRLTHTQTQYACHPHTLSSMPIEAERRGSCEYKSFMKHGVCVLCWVFKYVFYVLACVYTTSMGGCSRFASEHEDGFFTFLKKWPSQTLSIISPGCHLLEKHKQEQKDRGKNRKGKDPSHVWVRRSRCSLPRFQKRETSLFTIISLIAHFSEWLFISCRML